ncbi:MAG: hypothetical protein ACREBU_25080 [Nitrososphaera sp.]
MNPLVPGQSGAYLQNGDGVISNSGEFVMALIDVAGAGVKAGTSVGVAIGAGVL